MSVLRAQGLSVTVGSKTLLQPTDLVVQGGGLTAIVGANGAGKTTLLKALLGLVPAGGTVTLGDAPLASLEPKKLARQIAYLPQGQSHAWPLSVEAVVALGRHPHGGRTDDTVDRVLERLGLAGLREQSVLTLSGGEQMRVSLARALAVEASFLLADEPLASLDPRYQFEIMDVLSDEAARGTGVLIVMHDLAMAARHAGRIVLLKEGRVLADGPPQSVLTQSLVEEAFAVRTRQTEVERPDGTITLALPDGAA